MRHRFWTVRVPGILLVVGVAFFGVVAIASALTSAYGTIEVTNYGVEADIEVADPPVTQGDWSIIRVWVTDQAGTKYGELGWGKYYKDGQWRKDTTILWNSGSGRLGTWLEDYPVTCCGAYTYRIVRKSSPTDNWEFIMDDVLVGTKDLNFDTGNGYNCGGEVSRFGDGMGVGACLYNKYKNPGGSWTDVTSPTLWSDVSPDHGVSHTYHAHGMANDDWQISGNN